MSDREPLLQNQVATNQPEEPTRNALSSEVSLSNADKENGQPSSKSTAQGKGEGKETTQVADAGASVQNTSQNASATSASAEKPVTRTITAAEGFLTICGGCKGKVLFPLGMSRVICVHCNAINYLDPHSLPSVSKKALLLCPQCKSSILYTIGCTHFQCVCGCCIEIPIPDYYIPHFQHKMVTN